MVYMLQYQTLTRGHSTGCIDTADVAWRTMPEREAQLLEGQRAAGCIAAPAAVVHLLQAAICLR